MEKCNIRFLKNISAIILLMMIAVCFNISPCQAQNAKIYISTQDGSKLLVFDLASHQLLKTLTIYTPSPLAQVLPPNSNDLLRIGRYLFMTVPGSEISSAGINELKVIDTRTDQITATIKTDLTPSGMLEYQGKVYVVNRYGYTIQEIDPQSLAIVRSISFRAPDQRPVNNPLSMEIANGKIYLPYPGGLARPGVIQVLDFQTGRLIKTIEFSSVSPYGPLAIRKISEEKLYLGGIRSIGVLDTRTDSITKTIALSSREIYVQSLVLAEGKVYAANGVSTVNVIDPRTDTLITDIDTGYHDYACHLKAGIAAAEGKVLIADAGRGIKIIDTRSNRLVLTIVSAEPLGPVAIVTAK